MKLAIFIPAFAAANEGHVDGASHHLNGCVWPEKNSHPDGHHTYADDEYARFDGLNRGIGEENPYSGGQTVIRQCPTHCVYDGSEYSCSGYEVKDEFICHYKDGRKTLPGRHYLWVKSDKQEGAAVFFKTTYLNQYRKISKNKKCDVPVITPSDPDALCGEKPQIPTDRKQAQEERILFDVYTVWNDDETSVTCGPGGTPVRSNNYEPLNLICAKVNSGWKWMHSDRNGKTKPAGNKWLSPKFLCKQCHSKCEGDGGDGGEGSGAESPESADVSL